MSTLKSLSETTKADARRAGKLPKAPKKPKQSATVRALENYVIRHNAYVDKINAMAAKYKRAGTLKKAIFGRG
jgi:hypothetical protein